MNCFQSTNSPLSPIYLFQGEGVDPTCLQNTERMLDRLVKNPVLKIDYSNLTKRLDQGTFLMAGGNGHTQWQKICSNTYDVHNDYSTRLLTDKIRYGQSNYIGICAGAYLAMMAFFEEMPQSSRKSQLVGAEWTVQSLSSENQKLRHRVVKTCPELTNLSLRHVAVAQFGGPDFIDLDRNVKILATFEEDKPAILEKTYSYHWLSSKALIFSYHPEFVIDHSHEYYAPYFHPDYDSSISIPAIKNSQSEVDAITSLCFSRLGLKTKEQAIPQDALNV